MSACSIVGFISGGIGSAIAEVLTLPADTVKVRMQLDVNQGLVVLCKNMLTKEGIGSFFFGIEPAVIRQLTYGSMRYGLYPPIIAVISPFLSFASPFAQKMIAGLFAGCSASAICNPTDLVKVRMQSNLQSKNYSSFLSSLRFIIETEGFFALYHGVIPTVCRASVLAAVEMSIFESLKHNLRQRYHGTGGLMQEYLCIVVAALIAALFSSFASSPFDVARSRIMADTKALQTPERQDPDSSSNATTKLVATTTAVAKSSLRRRGGHDGSSGGHNATDESNANYKPGSVDIEKHRYRGVVDCIVRSVHEEGVGVLWAGFWALYLRLGPNTVLTFLCMEFISSLLKSVWKC